MPSGRTSRHALLAVLACAGVLCQTSVAYATTPDPATNGVEPALVGLTVSPETVDVSAAPAPVAVSAHVVDPSGITSVALRLADGPAVPLSLTAGAPADGIWTGVANVAAFTAHGALDAAVDAVSTSGAAVSPIVDDAVVVSDTVPPAPASIAVTAERHGVLAVTWTPPPANGGSPVASYDVTAAPAPGSAPDAVVPPAVSVTAEGRSASLTGLSDDTRYVVRVAARNTVGAGADGVADATTAVGALTVPDAPTGVVATPRNGALEVAWTVPSSSGGTAVTWYEVRATPHSPDVASPPLVTVAAGSPAAAVGGLVNGVAYDVAVIALNAVGPSLPGNAVGTPRTVPGAPRVTEVRAGDRRAIVRWAAPATTGGAPVTSYVVTAVPSGKVVTVAGDKLAATVTGLPNGVATRFTVIARNAAGSGPASAVSATVTPRLVAKLTVVTQPAGAIKYGTASTVVASLTAAGVAVPGQIVELMGQVRPSTTWKRLASGTTGSTGRVTLRTTLPATAALRLRHPMGAVSAPDAAVRSVAVATRVGAAPSAARVRLGMSVTVRGSIAPAHPTGSVVRLQRYVGGEWRHVTSGRMTTATAYKIAWQPSGVATYPMRVVKPADAHHATGISAKWTQTIAPENALDVARAIRANSRITLETTHVSGFVDRAHARANIVDVSDGQLARRSAYQNAPGGFTTLDIRMLKALRRMGQVGRVTVSEIAGGSHSRGSAHYSGRAIDVSWVNGTHVSGGSSYGLVLDACRAFGAARIFHPRNDPYGGHAGHVHCDW